MDFYVFSRKYRHGHHCKHFQWLGNVVWNISDENIFIDFPTLILNHVFCSISLKISCFLQQTWRLCTTTADKTDENHWIFRWNHAQIMVQNRSWTIDENIFHQKCPKRRLLATEAFPVMAVTIFPRKTMKNHAFSYQSATVGLFIVNQPYHAHARALHCVTRLVTALRRLYLCEF